MYPQTSKVVLSKDEEKIEKLIGSGSHGHVFSLSSDESTCAKASRVGETCYIECELITLRHFANDSTAPDQIPILLSMGTLRYNIRNSDVSVPAFLFKPRGKPAASLERTPRLANKMWEDISCALNYSHKKKIFHLDCRLGNFIWDDQKEVFVLVDWSSSAVIVGNKGIKGFRGALPFASGQVHTLSANKSWMPQNKHDFSSLGFSIAAFIAKDSVPWPGFSQRITNKDDSRFEDRRKIASAILVSKNMSKDILNSFNGENNKH